MLTNAIENAQKNLESRNFDSRKHVLQYDEVMNEQRKIIYAQRQMVLDLSLIHICPLGSTGIWIATPLAWAMGASVPVIRYYSGKWINKKLV